MIDNVKRILSNRKLMLVIFVLGSTATLLHGAMANFSVFHGIILHPVFLVLSAVPLALLNNQSSK